MEPLYNNDAIRQIERIKSTDKQLADEYETRKDSLKAEYLKKEPRKKLPPELEAAGVAEAIVVDLPPRAEEAIALAHFRPVMIIRNNKIVPEFQGPDVAVWKERLMEKEQIINGMLPAVGRVEVKNNALYKWVGTGWLVDTDIIVTNRHVASIFCQNKEGFAFKIGYPSGFQAANMDFIEEYQSRNSLEYDVESVLWIAPNDSESPDVAFMRIRRAVSGPPLPKAITLAEEVAVGEVVVTVGYPARDPDVPDQELVLRIFGNVYDKKRLAPGEIRTVNEKELEHDCSTLGGNSGSVVFSLSSGKAVGLHFAGLYMQSNYAVPATTISTLLEKLKQGTLQSSRTTEKRDSKITPVKVQQPIMQTPKTGMFTYEMNIPLKITVEIGGVGMPPVLTNINGGHQPPLQLQGIGGGDVDLFQQALAMAKQALTGQPGIISVEAGYRFRRGWITDEKVIAVEVQEKQTMPRLRETGDPLIPPQFLGIGVDVRTATVLDQLAFKNINVPTLEAVPSAGVYREPSNVKLVRIKDQVVNALFHVSPDSGWPNLKDFLSRVEKKLTATIYEWEAEHISDAIKAAMSGPQCRLRMVTQKRGTKEAVKDMQDALGSKFDHVFASVGKDHIVPTAYHIKVASRDGDEFWLSSGNWKNSNQADINPAKERSKLITPLREHNREWHVIIQNKDLAKMFQEFIEFDFDEATRVPLEEGPLPEDVFILIPEKHFEKLTERRVVAEYFDPLPINRVLDIQPLLTPDRDSRGRRLFIMAATEMIEKAKKTIDIENQSFSLLEENDPQYERFFNVLLDKQNAGVTIRVIFRDPREFPGPGEENLQKQLTRIKDFGFDTDNFKVQEGCHTKAIIVDSKNDNNAAVLFGSHNFTTSGALFNRDASLLIRDGQVARYFQQVFDFDWEILAKQSVEESVPISIVAREEEAPPGYRKVSLREMMAQMDS